MLINRSNIKPSRTLLILLGIILACLLILNAGSFYSVERIFSNRTSVFRTSEKNTSQKLIEKIDGSLWRSFTKKFHL
ncbi:MAG: hypothetical protein GDA37_10175 [Ekhidna sp.]|nr:hypothetical protein [Ekhidna sp.]